MMDPWNMPWMETAKSVEEDPINGFNKDWMVVSDKVEIDAPAQLIWDILVDLKKYNRWNPFCVNEVPRRHSWAQGRTRGGPGTFAPRS